MTNSNVRSVRFTRRQALKACPDSNGSFKALLVSLLSSESFLYRTVPIAGRLERRYNLRFPLATAMENQTLLLGLASLWAGSGARYTWRGVCGCASKISNKVLGQRPHEI